MKIFAYVCEWLCVYMFVCARVCEHACVPVPKPVYRDALHDLADHLCHVRSPHPELPYGQGHHNSSQIRVRGGVAYFCVC